MMGRHRRRAVRLTHGVDAGRPRQPVELGENLHREVCDRSADPTPCAWSLCRRNTRCRPRSGWRPTRITRRDSVVKAPRARHLDEQEVAVCEYLLEEEIDAMTLSIGSLIARLFS
jgi:hypothetical protein